MARPYSIKFVFLRFKNLPSLRKGQQQSLKLGHHLRAVCLGKVSGLTFRASASSSTMQGFSGCLRSRTFRWRILARF